MTSSALRILVLCTGNSARSIMAEALLNAAGAGRVRAWSAGSHPSGRVNPLALAQLRKAGLPAEGYRSKSWDEFATPEAPTLDIVITVCGNAAGETCPVWPGTPLRGHWGVDDPAKQGGSDEDKARAFSDAFDRLERKVRAFAALPLADLDRPALQAKLHEIGEL
ncbi:MAG: arsenate reductase ArsC [Burkholderiales bacterium]